MQVRLISASSLRVSFLMLCTAATPVIASPGPAGLADAVQAYDAAQVKGDRASLEQLLADDYLLVNSGGQVESKNEFIADLVAPDYKMEPYKVEHPIVRTTPDSAVMGGLSHLKGQTGGKPFDVCLRFVDVWILRNNRWQVVYSQAARAEMAACS
jgi:ketosteroid isomerase-like protein